MGQPSPLCYPLPTMEAPMTLFRTAYTWADRARAVSLGYGPDIRAMERDDARLRDALRTRLGTPRTAEAEALENQAVASLQRYVRATRAAPEAACALLAAA